MSLETLTSFEKNAMVCVLRDIGAGWEITPHPPAFYFFALMPGIASRAASMVQ